MDAIRSMKITLDLIHEMLETVIDTDEGTLNRVLPGSTVGSPLSIYAHAISNEDWAIQELLQNKPKLFFTQGWPEKLGLPLNDPAMDIDWSALQLHLPSFQEYAKTVYAETHRYLDSITPEDLDRELDWFGRRTETAAWVISDTILMHIPGHAGEIAALRGVMGQKGLPY